MAKVKVHNKGQKIVSVNGTTILPDATVQLDDTVCNIPAVKSLFRMGFLEFASSRVVATESSTASTADKTASK